MDFDEACLSSIINNGNRQESQILKVTAHPTIFIILSFTLSLSLSFSLPLSLPPSLSPSLQDYLQSKGITLKDMLEVCCGKLDGGDYHCTGRYSQWAALSWPGLSMTSLPRLQDGSTLLLHQDLPQVCHEEPPGLGLSVSPRHSQ